MTNINGRIIIYLDRYLNRIAIRYESGDINGMSETLKAISDPVRRDILDLLKDEKKSAGELAEEFHLTAATISYHLSIESKYKNYVYYELNASVFEELLVWLYELGGKKDES